MRTVFLFCMFVLPFFGEKTQILFHLHDAGETFAMLPVIKDLKQDYLVVASGVAERLVEDLPEDRIRSIESLVDLEADIVVTGVAAEVQGQTLDLFRNRGVLTIAFWDNFNASGPSAYFERAHQIEKRAEILFLPSESLLDSFKHRLVEVVGHPTLDTNTKPKLAVWIGGYGEEYDEAYTLFQEGMKGVEGYVVLKQHHPKTGLKNDLTTREAISVADVVICHQSSAAFQALAQNKPVLHVIPETQEFTSVPLEKGIAKMVSRVEDFRQALEEVAGCDVSGFYEVMGIPVNSKEAFSSALSQLCTHSP